MVHDTALTGELQWVPPPVVALLRGDESGDVFGLRRGVVIEFSLLRGVVELLLGLSFDFSYIALCWAVPSLPSTEMYKSVLPSDLYLVLVSWSGEFIISTKSDVLFVLFWLTDLLSAFEKLSHRRRFASMSDEVRELAIFSTDVCLLLFVAGIIFLAFDTKFWIELDLALYLALRTALCCAATADTCKM